MAITIPKTETRISLIKNFEKYNTSSKNTYKTLYILGGDIPVILEKYCYSEYIKVLNTPTDNIAFKMLDFVCDHFSHNGYNGSGGSSIESIILFCEQNNGKTNCRGLAILLAALLRLNGIKARHITCMPYEDPCDDCHVVVDCLLPSGKRIMFDPTYRLYFKDSEGEYISLEGLRKALINDIPIFENATAAYNGNAFDKEYYRNYMTKNTMWFSRGTVFEYGSDEVNRIQLMPLNYPVDKLDNLQYYNITHNDNEFWMI